jgi:hypothetical protein
MRADYTAPVADPQTPEAPDEPSEATTAWHPLLVFLLERFLPRGWRLTPELLLSRMPQRVDIVVVRQVDVTPGPVEKLHSIFDHLRPHTLIEHKGPADDLAREDALVLLAYGAQYMRLHKLHDPGEVCLMVVCDQITEAFVKQVERHGGSFQPTGGGLHHGTMAGFPLHGVATREVFKTAPSERLLYSFSRRFLQGREGMPPLDQDEVSVYLLLGQQIEQFRRTRGTMALKDLNQAEENYANLMAELVARYPEILRKVPLKDRLEGAAPEDLLHLAMSKLSGDLTADQLLDALSPEMRAELAKRLAH